MLSVNPGTKLGRIHDKASMESLRKAIQGVEPSSWVSMFTPPPLQEEDIGCFVEVQVTQRKPGRCIRLGGRIPACQSNEIVSVDTDECK